MIIHLLPLNNSKTGIPLITEVLSNNLGHTLTTDKKPKRFDCRLIYLDGNGDKSKPIDLEYYINPVLVKQRPVVILYNSNIDVSCLSGLREKNPKTLKLREFSSDQDIREILTDYFWRLESSHNKTITLAVPADIEDYLDWVSYTRGGNQADILRSLLDQKMKLDKDYQEFLKS